MYKPLLYLALTAFGIFIYLFEQTMAVRLEYKVNSLYSKYNAVNDENDSLRLRLNTVAAYGRLIKLADEKKFFKPDEKTITYVD